MEEIFELLEKRIHELADELNMAGSGGLLGENEEKYFAEVFGFAALLCENYRKMQENENCPLSLEELSDYNLRLYSGIFPEIYEDSFTNPTKAVNEFGMEKGQLLCLAAAELRGAIPATYYLDTEDLILRLELMLEIYSAVAAEREDEAEISAETLKEILYSFIYDNYESQTEKKIRYQLIKNENKWARNITDENVDSRLLYLTGEYIGENELKIFDYLNNLPDELVKSMADTYVGGYVKGFEVTGRDLSIKDTAEIRFNVGFIPMMKYAAGELREHKLDITMMRAGYSIFTGRSVNKNGFYGANPNPQYDFDHKDDLSLVMDEMLNEWRLECLDKCYEKYSGEAKVYAGPAVVETFGEEDFEPIAKAEAASHTAETRKLLTEYMSKAGEIVNKYIPGDERSFTIIAFPLPSIGEEFEAIFKDTIKINTLDYVLYRDIQQKIIDTLDTAEYVYIKGMGENRTDLSVHLHSLNDSSKETIFENCVADVNIPVGEVFTSPVLDKTCGTLNVCKVFLNGLEYRNLTLEIENGMIKDYFCDNFSTGDKQKDRESGRKLIEDNILFHHETLPMGECAIGTNTTAFEIARRYGIEAKMPILIAEKTGPHFAFGDTCYSKCEDLAVYNPDGKEIIARDNECSILRKTDVSKAYFNCHTDITIPYDELGELSALRSDGNKIPIILNGRFVLEGCEELNIPLEKL